MMLKKYVQPSADTTSVTPDVKTTASPCATITSVPDTDGTISLTTPAKLESDPTVKNEMFVSAIDKHLATNSITVLEKHYPEIESELNEIGYLLNGIAEHIDEAEDLIHTLRKAIAESDGKFTYNPKKLPAEQRESVQKVMLLLKQCGIFSEVTILNTYSGMVSTATRVRSFISGLWLELFSQQHGIEIISEKAKQFNLPYEVLCNVKVADKEGVQHEIDLMFSIGEKVFAIEQKSGVNFFDYDRYRLLAEYLHLIPDRFMLVNSTLLDKDATKCITYFYRYYICNSADYVSTLSTIIDKIFTVNMKGVFTMSNYNPYTDFRTFTGKIDLMGEVVPVKSWFETYPNELCFYQETEPMPYPAVISHVATNHITPLDMHIICIVATLTFVTTKQINDCLTMLEIPHSETNVKSSVERLTRHQMLRMSHFGVDAEHCCKFYVYSLNKNGADIAKVRGISSNFTPMQPATAPADMKRILVQNQAWLSFIKSGLNLDYLKRSEIITAKEEKTAVVRPSIALSMDNDPLFIEIIRKGDFWERYLIDKLTRYKALLDNWTSNNWGIENKPLLILNGENEEHNRRILALASDVGLEDLYFTEDTLLCGSQFYHSIYQFHDNGQREFFCFDQPTIDVA